MKTIEQRLVSVIQLLLKRMRENNVPLSEEDFQFINQNTDSVIDDVMNNQ